MAEIAGNGKGDFYPKGLKMSLGRPCGGQGEVNSEGEVGLPFSKGSETPLAGRVFMEGPGGGFPFPFQREAKILLAERLFSWRAQGGFRISPLRALQTTRNPPETGCSTGACGPPRRNRLPPEKNRPDKGGK